MLQSPLATPVISSNNGAFLDLKIDPTTTKLSNVVAVLPIAMVDKKDEKEAHAVSFEAKKKAAPTEKVASKRASTTEYIAQSSPLSTSTPSTPQPFFNAARNHSFSSSQQSLQSNISDQLLDHSHLKPGQNASLLSYDKTINMYRENAKKSNNMDIQCDFAIFLVEAAKRLQQKTFLDANGRSSTSTGSTTTHDDGSPQKEESLRQQQFAYLWEAEKLLKQVSLRGHSESQYYLANMYAAGLLSKTSRPDFDKAFPLFVQSAKHHHPDAAYRAAKCYEDGLGTRKDKSKAVQYYRKAATLNHPGAMYRLGLAEMRGELTLSRNVRDGHKWLKRSAEAATTQYPHALHELALLHEKGVDSVIFADLRYAVSLYHEAAVLGYAPSAHRLGECYEFGKLECPVDPALSIQYYSIAADQNLPESCFALTAWYLVGVPNVLPPSDEQAYAWAMCAAKSGFPRAEYAVGYFTEMGIGITKNESIAMAWYRKAAEHGEKRAIQKLQPQSSHQHQQKAPSSTKNKDKSSNYAAGKPLPYQMPAEPNVQPATSKKRTSFASISLNNSQKSNYCPNFLQRATGRLFSTRQK